MSPILVRPVREQLEHDRVIRQLQAKYKRRFTVAINPGAEQTAPVGTAPDLLYPDVVLTSLKSGKKLEGVIEVETNESVNQLEAMAQWARLGRLPVEFILYVPSGAAGVARRLCSDHGIGVTQIWTFHTVGDQPRWAQVHAVNLSEKLAAARAVAAEARRASAREAESARTPAGGVKARPKRAGTCQDRCETAGETGGGGEAGRGQEAIGRPRPAHSASKSQGGLRRTCRRSI